MRLAPVLIVCVLLAGCANAPTSVQTAGVAAPRAPVTLATPTFRVPVVLGAAGPDGAEPNIVATASDRIFVTNAPSLWRSVDGGSRFEALGNDSCYATLPGGNCPPWGARKRADLDAPGDMDLASDANGTLYFAGLDGKSGGVPFQVSRDDGASWSAPIDIANGNRTDREWIDALPNGTIYVTWRDFGSPRDAHPENHLVFRRGPDGGAHWDAPVFIGNDTLEGPLAHDPLHPSVLYAALYEHGIQMARSRDEGASWSFVNVTREAPDRHIPGDATSTHIITAVDAAGTVYVAWSNDISAPSVAGGKDLWVPSVKMSVSRDGGDSWSAPLAISLPGHAAVMPWLVAGQAGRVALAWYENERGTPNEHAPDVWDVVLAESIDANATAPTFVRAKMNAQPVHVGAICTTGGGCDSVACANDVSTPVGSCARTRLCFSYVCAGRDRSRLDLFELGLRPNGQPIAVWTADADAGSPDRSVRLVVGGVETGTPIGG